MNRALKLPAPDATPIAPLQYTLLIWAMILGYLFFGDVPDRPWLVGALFIVGRAFALSLYPRPRARWWVPSRPFPAQGQMTKT